ncbi:MAG: phenylacetate--CoA ligase [Epulopiscium sp.]|nr:phenylacetate--CoA ligase [Candidatus Epulonipiscium sp.]
MIWSREETLGREKMEEIQIKRLKNTIKRVYDKVPFYRQRLDEIGITPEDIHSLEELKKIPFTEKEDLREHYPFGLFAVPKKELVRVHGSSGTTGKPTVVGYTRNDLNMWTELTARMAATAGATDEDVAQIAFGYGLFTGAFGLHYGLEKIGAMVVPMSSGNTEKQIMLMKDFETTLLVSTPSYALHIAEVAEQMGIDPVTDLKIGLGLFGGEGHTEEMRRQLEKKWGMIATENYGMSELIGPGVSGECQYKCGMHIAEDHFIAEIIDPVTEEVLPLGKKGELVITTITKEALPLLRYRTKDITYLIEEKCECGRTLIRMAKVQGRSDDMLIIRGVNIFPSQIESVLVGMEEIGPHYEIIVKKKGYMDTLELNVELIDGRLLERYSKLQALKDKISHNLRTVLGIDAKINLVEPKTLKRFEGKAKRVIDLR